MDRSFGLSPLMLVGRGGGLSVDGDEVVEDVGDGDHALDPARLLALRHHQLAHVLAHQPLDHTQHGVLACI